MVTARLFLVPLPSCVRPFIPSLCASTPPPLLPCPCLLFFFLALSVVCPVGSRAQRWHTAPYIFMRRRCGWPCGTRIARSCTFRCGPAFSTCIDDRTIRSCWIRGVSRCRRPLLIHPFFSSILIDWHVGPFWTYSCLTPFIITFLER